MSNATPSRLGQADLAGDVQAIFLKVFAGEVLTAFETGTVMKSLTRQRQISSGKSASFPAMYKASTEYHVPGAEILGNAIAHNEIVIAIDDLLLSDVFIANIDEAMNHYDVRSTYTTEMGRALALAYDKNVARMLLKLLVVPHYLLVTLVVLQSLMRTQTATQHHLLVLFGLPSRP